MANDKKINSLYNSFVFIGEPFFNQEKNYTSKVSDSGYKYSRVQFGVKTADGNVVYTDLMGGFNTTKKNVIYSMDKDRNRLEIDFNDRHDKKIIENVADFRKLKVNFTSTDEKDSNVFISEYDMVEFIKDNMPNLTKGQRIVVIGNISIERYKNEKDGKVVVNTKYVPTKIRLAKEDEKNKAELRLNFVFDKESLETDRLAKEGKLDITGFFTTYNRDTRGNIFVQLPMVIDVNYLASISNVPLDDTKKVMLTNMLKGYFKAESGVYVETEWRADLFRGNQVEEIKMEDLSDDQKMQIELGIVTFEQVAKEMGAKKSGDRINEIRLVRPTMKYEDKNEKPMANKITELVDEDFIIKEVQVEDKSKLFDNSTQQEKGTISGEDVLAELFG